MAINKWFDGRNGSYFLFILSIIWNVLLIIPIQIDESSTTTRVIYSLFCWMPLALALYSSITNYIIVLFNDDPDDDDDIDLIGMMITAITVTINWAPIFVLLWVWNNAIWTDVIDTAYDALGRFTGMSLLMAAGIGFTTHVPVTWYASLIAGVMGFSSQVIVIGMALSTTIEIIVSRLARQSGDSKEKISGRLFGGASSQIEMKIH